MTILGHPVRDPSSNKEHIALQRGFTLVEAVIVIVITGIVAAAVAVFIRLPVQGYVDSVARAEVTDTADTALRRMARDIRLALPNSVRVSSPAPDGSHYIELLLTKTGGRYLAEEDNPIAGNILKFDKTANCATTSTDCLFNVFGPPAPAGSPQQIVNGDFIVVYNLGPGLNPADAYANGNRARVTEVATTANTTTLTLDANPFASQNPTMRSPTRRFQVVTSPVTYRCDPGTGTLTRFWNYPIQPSQPVTLAALGANTNNALLARDVTACDFSYATLATQHSALVGLQITMQRQNSGPVTLIHQVHVDNTP